ncbi:mitochondrial import receptor subunit TOM22 homolog isoform X1 [Ursus maritimus]|uniref:Mitochondrial import receptor subunit TOM22 homolog n=1 Tax=Ursus maritimus TaxID=29073 RepID=A0A8M1GCU4_URSMA|nr:mitochondrial import receptor subunit TOM22 homolog isoform X1 [Ursus arctos]XP_040493481.1 mitochondrial import receptor subunit TOM22 homolog isoform X1 [Ursus maritimus]
MAAAAAAGGPGAPLSPDELLPKGDSEKTEEELEEEDDEESRLAPPPPQLDETLSERLWGLTEMFPERVRSAAGATFDLSLFVAQKMYRFSRAALWIGTTSFMILVLPVVFETEKLQMEQQQQLQQRQILLGPNTGLSGGMPGALPSLPGKI